MRHQSLCRFLAGALVAAAVTPAVAQEPRAPSDECTNSPVEYSAQPGLTREEMLERMDDALYRSLNKYDECQETARRGGQGDGSNASGGMAGGGDGESGSASGGASGTGRSGQGSVASSDMSGEGERDGSARSPSNASMAGRGSAASGDMQGDRPAEREAEWSNVEGGANAGGTGTTSQPATDDREGVAMANGKAPEDIPPADNDSVLEAQIRRAAEQETDPELKKKLWNEYRRYKGLPQVD